MIRKLIALCIALLLALTAPLTAHSETGNETLRQQVEATEKAFAATMADREFEAFVSFLSDEAIFISGGSALRGKQQVADAWQAYFEGEEPPFSWSPRTVEVLDSGELALSSGPVLNSKGDHVADFNSIWRQEQPGQWRIIFDKGNRACPPPAAEPPAAEEN